LVSLGVSLTNVLGIIPARGGSKSVPRKNIVDLGGRPLIAWTIEAALRATRLTRVIVSTDDAEIADVARSCGGEVPFVRPATLAADDSPALDLILHALGWLAEHESSRPDIVAYLQPTSPFRAPADIDGAIELLERVSADAVVSVTPVREHPYWVTVIDSGGWLRSFLHDQEATSRRQDLPPAYALNGAVYVARPDVLERHGTFHTDRTAAFVMPRERSADIDTPQDLELARLLLQGRP
jgi:N-acylneuraminate cytidylyltransferase/CMP-N,N'-diacetyllegionaminic acid synthase